MANLNPNRSEILRWGLLGFDKVERCLEYFETIKKFEVVSGLGLQYPAHAKQMHKCILCHAVLIAKSWTIYLM